MFQVLLQLEAAATEDAAAAFVLVDVPKLAMAFTSCIALLMEQTSNFPCVEPQALGNNELLCFVRSDRLAEQTKGQLVAYILEQSEKYGHFWAMAIKYLRFVLLLYSALGPIIFI